MTASERASRPHAVLFACGMNAVRSPMAAGLLKQMLGKTMYVASAGVQKGDIDPFAISVMQEIGIDISRHKPITFEELEDLLGRLLAAAQEAPRVQPALHRAIQAQQGRRQNGAAVPEGDGAAGEDPAEKSQQ